MGINGSAFVHDWSFRGCIVAGAGLTKTMAPRTEAGEVHLPLLKATSDVRDFYRNFVASALGKEVPLAKNEEVRRILNLMEAAFE